MKYTKEERLEISKRVYEGEYKMNETAEEFGVRRIGIDNYIRLYRQANGLPARENGHNPKRQKLVKIGSTPGYEEFDSMTRDDDLI